MVDAADSKSAVGNYMWVQVPPPAPEFQLVDRSLTFAVLSDIGRPLTYVRGTERYR